MFDFPFSAVNQSEVESACRVVFPELDYGGSDLFYVKLAFLVVVTLFLYLLNLKGERGWGQLWADMVSRSDKIGLED